MTVQQIGIATLIKCALENRHGVLPEDFDFADAVRVALRHKIIGLVYYGAVLCDVDRKSEQMQRLFQHLVLVMERTEEQHMVHQRLMSAFEENCIHYMPLKGVVIQDPYPKIEMSTIFDADMLSR